MTRWFQIKQMALLNGGQRGGDSPTKLRVLGAARKSEVKATQNLSIIVAFFAVCWMPLYTINCVHAFCDQCPVPASLIHACIVLSHLNSAGNPLLYAYHLKDFRSAFKSLLLCKNRRRRLRDNCTAATAAATSATANGYSISSMSYSSNGSVDCWRWPAKSIVAGSMSLTHQQSGDLSCKTNSTSYNCTSLIVVDPSVPVLLSVRQLVDCWRMTHAINNSSDTYIERLDNFFLSFSKKKKIFY